ncbi:hypothetical protein F5Y04DRAFT_282785 [Hypomontagnella monticulosa]|nr:hypothetical protein F5Y04DRAFT_282785 [Hypomontagnella monticulosa]
MASVFVALRFAARLTNGNPLWLDDYFILISTLISISYSIFTGIGDRLGAGLDLWAVPQENLPTIYKLVLAGTVVSVIARGFIRVSVSMFLMRIFSVSTTRRPIILTLVLNVAITVAFTICIVFECTPISHFWDGWDGLHKGTCVNQWDMFLACSCIATTLDVILILLPMRWISQLQFPHSKKIATLAMFAISAIIVRILYLLKLFTDPASATRTLADLVVWGNLEIYVAIICACLPSLRPLLKLALSLRLVATHRVKARSSWPLDSTGQQMSSESRRRLPSDDIQYPDVDKVVNRSPNIWLTTTVQQQYEERSYPQSETNFTRAAINGIELHDRHQAIPRGGSWT